VHWGGEQPPLTPENSKAVSFSRGPPQTDESCSNIIQEELGREALTGMKPHTDCVPFRISQQRSV